MINRLSILLIISIILSFPIQVRSQQPSLKLYVSPLGNDQWSGRIKKPNHDKTDGPFATLEGARNEIRKLKNAHELPAGKVIVEIRKGVYQITSSFVLEAGDGGTDSLSPVIYLGEKGKDVQLTGAAILANWESVHDTDVLKNLNGKVQSKISQSNLLGQGITDFGSPGSDPMELFFGDKPMKLSRYPNTGFIKVTGVQHGGSGMKGDTGVLLNYEDPRVNQWEKEKDAWVQGYWFYDWKDQKHKVVKIDIINKYIEVAPPYHQYGYRAGQWFFGFNLLSEIDEPGEYYIDRTDGILYFYPPSTIKKGKATVSLSKNILSINGVSNLQIRGITIEGCRETGIRMNGCNNTLIAACTIRNTGDWAVTIDGGHHNGVKDCKIYDVGAGGIRIMAGDLKTLTPAECYADNNYIHHIARLKRIMNPGITLNGAGNRASHNLIAYVPHVAIYFNGNDNTVEYNEIHHACYETNDSGPIYAGRSWIMRGNVIRYNYLHDINGFEKKGCVGIYLDDLFCGTLVYGNIFNRVTSAVLIGGGRDNQICNNIFMNCEPALQIDARGLGWYSGYIPEMLKEAQTQGTLSGIAFTKPPYSTCYPVLKKLIDDKPAAPKGNIISHNICLGGSWDKPAGFWKASIEKEARPYLIIENNIVSSSSETEDSTSSGYTITDPMFINKKNPEKGKFRIENGSPALKLGFRQIPFKEIGLQNKEKNF
ncbi:MAG: right-handed parallel beta-helix repeat-containing protein [Bacteroidota bacterium]|nr:right-handed parallel beta-helix repeat-containing protein [Bacteroidota bacterium]